MIRKHSLVPSALSILALLAGCSSSAPRESVSHGSAALITSMPFQQIPGATGADVGSDALGINWVAQSASNGQEYSWSIGTPLSGTPVGNQSGVAIDLGAQGPWVITAAHDIYGSVNGTYGQIGGQATDVGVSPDGNTIYVVGVASPYSAVDFPIYKWVNNGWTQLPRQYGIHIDAANDGSAYVTDHTGAVWHIAGTPSNPITTYFGPSGTNASDVTIGADGTVFVVGNDGQQDSPIYVYDPQSNSWDALPGATGRRVSASSGTHVSVVTSGGAVWTTANMPPGVPASVQWQGWTPLNGGLVTDPTIVAYDTIFDVFATGTNGTVWEQYFDTTAAPGPYWRDLSNRGNPLGPPVAVRFVNATEVFAVDTVTNHLLHQEITGARNLNPSGWEDLGGNLAVDKPAVVASVNPPAYGSVTPANQLNVFAKGTDGTVQYLAGFGYGNFGAWSGGRSFGFVAGTIVGEPGAVSWGPNRLDLFVVAANNGQLYRKYSNDDGVGWAPQPTWSGAPFDGWEPVGAPSGGPLQTTPSVVSYMPNRIDVFATALDSSVDHVAWTGASWYPWDQVAGGAAFHDQNGYAAPVAIATGVLSPPDEVTTGVGDIDVFVQGADRGLYMTDYRGGSSLPFWSFWSQVTSCFRTGGSPSVASRDLNSLQIAVTAYAESGDGSVWFNESAGAASVPGAGASSPPSCACGGVGEPCCNSNSCGAGWLYCGEDETCRSCGGGGQIECPWSSPNSSRCQSGLVVEGDMCVLNNGSVTCEAATSTGLIYPSGGGPVYCCPGGTAPKDGCVPDPTRPGPAYVCTCSGPAVTVTGQFSYYELGVTYTPPGNLSNVQYTSGTTLGSHVQIQESTAAGVTVQLGGPTFQVNGSYMSGNIDGTSYQVSSSGSWGPGIASVSDATDHTRDIVWLWLNAGVTATTQDSNMLATIGVPAGETMDIESFTIGEILGTQPVPASRSAKLAQLSATDRAAILATDPFVTGTTVTPSPAIDPNRFVLLYSNWVIRGPDHAGDPVTTFNFNTNNSVTNGLVQGELSKADLTLMVGAKVAFITEGSLLAGVTMEYNYQRTEEWDNGSISNANMSLASSTTCWHQTVNVYWDSMFGTFMFYPVTAGTSSCDIGSVVTGLLKDAEGRPLAGHVVTATVDGGETWSTPTNARGEYWFHDLPAGAHPRVRGEIGEIVEPSVIAR